MREHYAKHKEGELIRWGINPNVEVTRRAIQEGNNSKQTAIQRVKALYYDENGNMIKRRCQPETRYTTDPSVLQVELFEEALIEMQKEREQTREVLKGIHKHIEDGLKAFKQQVVTLKTASIVEFSKVNERISQLEFEIECLCV